MHINRHADIARDPWSKTAYFLSLMGGSKVQGWVDRNLDLLETLDPRELPPGLDIWKVIEQDFTSSFEDYTRKEQAFDKLRALKMREGRMDDYMSTFQMLTNRASTDPNNPGTLRLFTRGLPAVLCNTCIDHDTPDTLEQWVDSARQQHRNWLRKHAIHNDDNDKPRGPQRPKKRPYKTDTESNAPYEKASPQRHVRCHRNEWCYRCHECGHQIQDCPDNNPREDNPEPTMPRNIPDPTTDTVTNRHEATIRWVVEGAETYQGLGGAAALRAIAPGSLYIAWNKSISIPVIVNTRQHQNKSHALLDSGATENFLSPQTAKILGIELQTLDKPKRLWNVDGTLNGGKVVDRSAHLKISHGN
jgi:hypothetical protein